MITFCNLAGTQQDVRLNADKKALMNVTLETDA